MAETEPPAERPSTSTVAAWMPPRVTHTWTLEGVSAATIAAAAPGTELRGPVSEACGLHWQLSFELQYLMRPNKPAGQAEADQPRVAFFLNLLDRTPEPVKLALVTLRIHGYHDAPFRFTNCFWLRGTGDAPLASLVP